jgi:hypothetical protein
MDTRIWKLINNFNKHARLLLANHMTDMYWGFGASIVKLQQAD